MASSEHLLVEEVSAQRRHVGVERNQHRVHLGFVVAAADVELERRVRGWWCRRVR
jgi:hypothetical protein